MLIATGPVSEQTVQSRSRKGDQIGVPVRVVDWPYDEAAALAARCTVDPDSVAVRV